MVAFNIYLRTAYLPTRVTDMVNILTLLSVACIYGFFSGAGLGIAFGGWKTGLKFGLIGLAANAVGSLAGYFISSSVWAYRVPLGLYGPSYIQHSIMGALAGGILGWFFGKERQPRVDPVMRTGNP
jgi:hypothetical protein